MNEFPPRRTRRRSLIVLGLLAIAGVAVFVAWVEARARGTARAIRTIESLNGLVLANPLARAISGPEYSGASKILGPPDDVSFLGPKVGDRELEVLNDLPGLRRLELTNSRVTDAGVARLARFPKLNSLSLANIDLTKSAGPKAASLNMPGHWTGKGLKALKSLPDLRSISLAGPHVTDADLPALTSLKRLLRIDLYQTNVTKEGIESLRRALPNCQVLYR